MVYDTASIVRILAFWRFEAGGVDIIRTPGDINGHEGDRIFVTIVNIQKSPPIIVPVKEDLSASI